MVSESDFLHKAQSIVARFDRLKGSDRIPDGLAADLKTMRRMNLALIEAKIADIDEAVAAMDGKLNAGTIGKDEHRKLYCDFVAQRSDLESDRSMLSLCDVRGYVGFLRGEVDEKRYGSYDSRPKVDPKAILSRLGKRRVADDSMLIWGWAFVAIALCCIVTTAIMSSLIPALALLSALCLFLIISSAIIFSAARYSQVEEVTWAKAMVFSMSASLITSIFWVLAGTAVMYGYYTSGSVIFRGPAYLLALERSFSMQKVIVHTLFVVVNFVVSVACARRVFATTFEKAASTVILGYAMGIVAWIVIAVLLLQHLIA
jgi:hypothetical protein